MLQKVLLPLLLTVCLVSGSRLPHHFWSEHGITRMDHPDMDLNTPEMIIRRGYPAETHYATTEDGYIIQMHRIPRPGSPVIFIQHGLLCSSADFIILGPELGLPYILYDAGYDVWLGNARGNYYSRNHTTLNPDTDSEFWKFTFHQMGVYDVPAEVDYMLAETGESQVVYMGHSMGTTMFWVMASERPEYNAKIKQMHALAPVAFMGKVISPIRHLAPYVNELEFITNIMGWDEFLPSSDFYDLLGQNVCSDESPYQAVCTNLIFLICGYDSQQLNETTLPVIMNHTPAGTSSKTLIHYAQEINSGLFQQYDHGLIENNIIYGQPTPPNYDIGKITAPVYLHYSINDWLAHPDDVFHLNSLLPNSKAFMKVSLDEFNHLDFIWAIDVKVLLFDDILNLVNNPLP